MKIKVNHKPKEKFIAWNDKLMSINIFSFHVIDQEKVLKRLRLFQMFDELL